MVTEYCMQFEVTIRMYRVFSHDVTRAMLVSQNKEMAAMLMPKLNLWELNSIFMQKLSFQ